MIKKIGKLSVATAIFILVFLLMTLFPRFEDPDFYWHIKTGEYILSTYSFPRADIFTYTNYGHQWVLSEWLSQVILYLIFHFGGFVGIGVFVASAYTLCWFINYLTCKDILGDEGKAILATMGFCAFFGGVAPRPHIFTFLFFSILMRILFSFKYHKNDKGLIFIPLIMILWANMHGGFFIGLVLVLAFVITEWVRCLWGGRGDSSEKTRLAKVSLIGVASFLATAINPDLFRYWRYPYDAIIASGDTNIISEWQSPNFHEAIFLYFLFMVFVFFLCAVFSKKNPDLTEICVPLIFVAGAFISVRNLPLAALSMSPFFSVFYKNFSLRDMLWSKEERSEFGQIGFSGAPKRILGILESGNKQVGSNEYAINWIILAVSLIAILLIYPNHKKALEMSMASILPVKAVDFLVQNKIEGRMFNAYHYGGYLIYRLHPKQKVFVYGRTDIYQRGFLKEFNSIYRGEPNWKRSFDRYAVDYVICESVMPIKQLLLEGREFKLVYDDGNHSVLLRDTGKYKDILAKYGKK